MPHRTSTISAENTFTSFLALRGGDTASISVSGSFSGTVVLQRSFDGVSNTYRDVANPDGTTGWTQPIETSYYADESSYLRIGIKTGGFVSGSALVRIGTDTAQPYQAEAAQAAFLGRGAMSVNVPQQFANANFGAGGRLVATL